MSGIELILGTLYVAGTIRAAITSVKEAKNFSKWVKKKQLEKVARRKFLFSFFKYIIVDINLALTKKASQI